MRKLLTIGADSWHGCGSCRRLRCHACSSRPVAERCRQTAPVFGGDGAACCVVSAEGDAADDRAAAPPARRLRLQFALLIFLSASLTEQLACWVVWLGGDAAGVALRRGLAPNSHSAGAAGRYCAGKAARVRNAAQQLHAASTGLQQLWRSKTMNAAPLEACGTATCRECVGRNGQ